MTGTSGAPAGTNGNWRGRHDRVALVSVIAATLVVGVVNALTVADDLSGTTVEGWEPWVWEFSSGLFWILAAVPLLHLLRRLRPPRLTWIRAVLAVALLSLPVCLAHVAFMAGVRQAIYAMFASRYGFDWGLAHLVYEWRKDLLTVALLAGIGFLVDRLAAATPAAPVISVPVAPPPYRLEVRDGNRQLWLAADLIERVEAAGNYVELHLPTATVLHRSTLAMVATQLEPHGFVRIHRSRLVRRDAVRAVTSNASGDFDVVLASGACVGGSRRFRDGLGRG